MVTQLNQSLRIEEYKSKQSMRVEEYKAKWAYVRHTESLQAKHVQWYFGIAGGVLAYLYGGNAQPIARLTGGPWVPILVLLVYSILINLRLLLQKRNYETYTARLKTLEGQVPTEQPIHSRALSVFKLQYYSVVLVGAVIAGILVLEITQLRLSGVAATASYLLGMVTLSFSSLLGGTSNFGSTGRAEARR